MLIKKDKNKKLEKILAEKNIDEQAKNLLQGILYKVEVSYKDYKKVKGKKQTEEKYVEELIDNIDKKCNKISIVKLSEKLTNKKIQKELEKNKFYVEEEIISYPIEEKILYAIEKKSRHPKILNNKYEEATIGVSELINTGKNMDRIEALRDFNGWSWATSNKEIENIEANLIYQTLQILLGEEFLENWCQDKDGIIDYLEQFVEEMSSKYEKEIASKQKELLIKIAIANTIKVNKKFAKSITDRLKKIQEEIEKYEDTKQKVSEISNHKKELLQELNQLEIIIVQEARMKEEFDKQSSDKKIFNIKIFEKNLKKKKEQLIEQISRDKYLLNPSNYLEEKSKLITQKEKIEHLQLNEKEVQKLLIEFIENFLKCFKKIIEKTTDEEEILKLIYQFRYFMLLPFSIEKSIKDVKKLQKNIYDVEKELVEKAIKKKVIKNVPIEVMKHVFETRIIILEELYYKIITESGKYYVQIFDENISEEKFEITPAEKIKINKKIKIFI